MRGLLVADESLYVLFTDELKIYRPASTIYLPQFADGMGVSTLTILDNLTSDDATGTVEFLDDDGNPAVVEVEGSVGAVSSPDFDLEANGSLAIQTTGAADPFVKGRARVTASRPIRGTDVYQVRESDNILFEAGVGDAQSTGLASVFVSTRTGPESQETGTAIVLANPRDFVNLL